jgi:peptide/nickel transport system substrate-binding protein
MRAHDFDVATLSWSSPDEVVDLYQIFHSSQAAQGSNYVGYSNPGVDRRLEQIRRAFDPAARAVLEREVHRLLFDDQVYLFLTLRPQLDAVKARVRAAPWRTGWYDLARLEVD